MENEKMILTKKHFLVNAFTRHFNSSCNMGLQTKFNGKEFYLMYRVEKVKLVKELIHLN